MARRFAEELEAVSGRVETCGSISAAQDKLAEMVRQAGWKRIGAGDSPLCHEIAAKLPTHCLAWYGDQGTPQTMADLDAGLVEAQWLLADTGSCLVANATQQQRLLCYLPPVCLVVASADRLVEHMPAVWEHVAAGAAETERRGEFVLITGPSRTADIEKILILGVHGPKQLVVFLVE
ncbi:MAG TPA: hypothetical protein EYP56_13820 [Planctomycetaceae bacterium]|nr:hypothetical protein [Planctomycetaceae bacterium]